MNQIKVYHYTHFSNVGKILGAVRQPGSPSGIRPQKIIHPLSDTKAISALLEPTPETWVNNPHFPDTWKILQHDLRLGELGISDGELLLEIAVDTKRDNVLVADRAYFEAALFEDKTGIPEPYVFPSLEEATKAFDASMIPIDEYLEEPNRGYSLPLVVIPFHVPVERISISSQQPLLEDNLRSFNQEERARLIYFIKTSYAKKGLIPWRTAYEFQHGPLEISRKRKETF